MSASGYVVNSVDRQAYLSALALADNVIVTCDSTSMISEAAISGKPIFVAHMKAKKIIIDLKSSISYLMKWELLEI